MICILKPSYEKIEKLIHNIWKNSDFSYNEVGSTQNEIMPSKYNHDINKIDLGKGEKVFLLAKEAIVNWEMYGMYWIDVHSNQVPIQEGEIAVTYIFLGLWGLNPCRIIYVVDEKKDNCTRFGFAFGTIASHPEVGEERFLIEWNHENDSVSYEIKAFSRPRHILARLIYPGVRYLQGCFFKDSLQCISRYVQEKNNA